MENSSEQVERAEDAAEILSLSNCKNADIIYWKQEPNVSRFGEKSGKSVSMRSKQSEKKLELRRWVYVNLARLLQIKIRNKLCSSCGWNSQGSVHI